MARKVNNYAIHATWNLRTLQTRESRHRVSESPPCSQFGLFKAELLTANVFFFFFFYRLKQKVLRGICLTIQFYIFLPFHRPLVCMLTTRLLQ